MLSSVDKHSFVDMLKGKHKSAPVSEEKRRAKASSSPDGLEEEEDGPEKTSKWEVLRSDFMLGATMKDWDKET